MARPNRKTKVATTDSADAAKPAAKPTPVPKADTQAEKLKEVVKKPKMVSVYAVNTAEDEANAPKRVWGPNTVNGTIVGIVAMLEEKGISATKDAILEAFAADEKSSRLVATEWQKTPMKYVEGYLHFLKGNRSLTSSKIEA